ncbi:MAG: tetratricopeptide repeat protein [Candidatus Aminicenantes bacterium]|nr:MAG: tetratricopeptide repeat protein [Candidatus Aminicenantes bacterium]
MKKLIPIIVLFMLVGPGMSNVGYGQAAADEGQISEKQHAKRWKKLARYAPFKLEFSHPLEDVKEYDQKPTFKQLFTRVTTKTLLLDMKPITKALEKSGLMEPVTLQLRTIKNSWILAQLGTFKPHEKKGKVIFPIPKIKSVTVMKIGFKEMLQFRLKNDIPLDRPEICILLFKDPSGRIKTELKANCYFPFDYERPEYETLDRLLAKEEYEKAEIFCANQKGKIQNHCYRILGDVFFEKGNYARAVPCYEKIAYKKGFDKLAMVYFEKGDYQEAGKYFEKGSHSSPRAHTYTALADHYRTKEYNPELAKTYYVKAIDEFEYLVKDYHYVWNKKDSDQRRRCIRERDSLPKSREENAQQEKLSRILEKAAAYCDRLYNNFFHFFCQEHITETNNLSWDIIGSFATGVLAATKDKYIYEYQLIREDKKVVEQRTLLEENGVTRNIPDAQLLTRNRYYKLIFGPIAFLSKYWQERYDYKILREDIYNGEKVVIIEAIPKETRKHNPLVGNIWIKEDEKGEIDILKLEWNPKTIMQDFEKVLKLEKRFKAKLIISFFAEFNIKRQGFRLPSRYFIEETYTKKKKKFVRTKTEVIFKKHRYFTVSSEVIKTERTR